MSDFKVQFRLSVAILGLAFIASLTGLLFPSVYRETSWVVPQNRGQDLVTLFSLFVFVAATLLARRGSLRAYLVWLGLIGYLSYTYTGASFAYGFNELFLVYVALFSLTGCALILGFVRLDTATLAARFTSRTHHGFVALFLLLMSAMLSVMWLGQIVPFLLSGQVPEMIVKAHTPTVFVFVLDLGVVVPVSCFSAFLLLKGNPLGFALTALVLVKASTMGWALLSMSFFSFAAGSDVSVGLFATWTTLAIFGTAMAWIFFASCESGAFDNAASVPKAHT